jgi:hypothetical protein
VRRLRSAHLDLREHVDALRQRRMGRAATTQDRKSNSDNARDAHCSEVL